MVLTLDDDFTPGMLKAAGATALLNRELGNLSGQSVKADRGTQMFVRDLQQVSREASGASKEIERTTVRMGLLADAAAIFGPGTVPVGGVLAAGVAGFASQLGFAAIAAGVLVGSMQGLGDALGAMNKAQLNPTNKNLEAAEAALKRLSPAAREFANAAFDLKPALVAIRDMGAEALMPGLTESLDSLERLGPKVAGIFQSVAGAAGEIAASGAESLASDRWAGFFAMIEADAPQALAEMASAVGDVTHGLAEMWEAFAPLNADFSGWLVDIANSFDGWATGLSATQGFTEFVDYIRETGPQVAETTAALANAILQIVQASAPLGGPALAALESVANVIASIADSDLGTPIMAGVAALSLMNRTMAVTAALSKTSMFGGLGVASKGIRGQAGSIRSDVAAMSDSMVAFGANTEKAGQAADRMKQRLAAGAGLAGFAVLATGAADGLGLTNTASLALMGSLGGPVGIAIGASAGALLDMRSAGMGATEAIQGLDAAVRSGDMGVLSEQIAAAKAELADITNLDFGGDVFDRIGFQWADTFGGPSMDDARKKIEASEKALKDLEWAEKKTAIEAKGAALAFLQQTGANVDLGKWSRKSADSIKAQAAALIASKDAAKQTASSFVTLGDSLNDSKTSLSDWIRQMSSSADALINFTRNSRRAAENGLNNGLIASLQDAGEAGALRMRQLANASESEIARANDAWRKGKKAMQDYVDFKVPPKKVTADTSRAMQSFREVDTFLSNLNGKTATTYVNTVRTVTGPQGAAVFGQKAGGGTVEGPRQPYGDKMLYLLAPGEEVISNRDGQADRWRPLLKAINGGLAGGGTAGKERARREEEARQRRLDAQRAKDLLASDLRDEAEQQRLELEDAQRRLRSARKAGRPAAEIREARLGVKQERADRDDARQARRDARAEEQARQAEARAEEESKRFLAAIDGQERAAQGLIDAAKTQKQSAESVRDGWAQAMDRAGSAATAGFKSDLFGSQQRGLWSGGKGGSGISWLDALSGDINGLNQRQGLIAQLSGQGITGGALEALLGQGSNDQIAALIGSGRAGEFASMFAQREALLASTSGMAGQAAYGAQFAAAAAQVAVYDARIAVLEAELTRITAQRPINIYETESAYATAMETIRLQALYGVV